MVPRERIKTELACYLERETSPVSVRSDCQSDLRVVGDGIARYRARVV